MEIVLAAINAKWIHPSLALRLLKANLGELEKDCGILEFALRQPLNEKVEQILAGRPRLLGLSVSIWNHLATLELLKALEEKWEPAASPPVDASLRMQAGLQKQAPLIVLGGPEVSWLPMEAEIFRHADYVIRGEGEESFRSLCKEIFFGNGNPNYLLTERNNNGRKVRFINSGETAINVNNIASPYRLYTDEDLGRKLIYVEASRGCPFGCDFCQGGKTPLREFPLEPFLDSMETLMEKGCRTFKFLDRTFNLNIERAIKIMEFFLDLKSRCSKTRWQVHFEMVPFRFPPELREVLRRFPPGTLRLELGIQTLNAGTAGLICRAKPDETAGPKSRDFNLDTLQFLRKETNAILHVDLIAGLPGEDLASFGAGFDRLWQVLSNDKSGSGITPGGFFEIQLGILKCLPGTPIAVYNETHGMKYSPLPSYEVIETGAIPEAGLKRIKNFARFWEIIVNRNPFPDLTKSLLPAGEPVFERFMAISDRLLDHFGKNWGIDRHELKTCLENLSE